MELPPWKRKRATSISASLPEEIEFEILSRLPVTTLLRFRAVCKFWRQLISSDPAFISAQFRNSGTDGAIKYAFLDCQSKWDVPRFLELGVGSTAGINRRQESTNNSFTKLGENHRWRLIFASDNFGGCSNGLICYYSVRYPDVDLKIYLLNPALNQCRILPESTPANEYVGGDNTGYLRVNHTVCLVYNTTSDDYEVVKIFYLKYPFGHYVGEIYSLRTNSWRSINLEIFPNPNNELDYHHGPYWNAVIYNGVPHWLARDNGDETIGLYVLDINQQKIRQISVLEGVHDMNVQLQLFEGCLSIYRATRTPPPAADMKFELWVVMKEEGEGENKIIRWTKKNIVMKENVRFMPHLTTSVTGNVCALMCKFIRERQHCWSVDDMWKHCLISYDLENQTIIEELSLGDFTLTHLFSRPSVFCLLPKTIVVDYVPTFASLV